MRKDLYRRVNNQFCIDDMVHIIKTGVSATFCGSRCEKTKTYKLLGTGKMFCEGHGGPSYMPCNGCLCAIIAHRDRKTLIGWE